MKRWSSEQVAAVSGFVSYLVEMLDLEVWTVVLKDEPANIGAPDAAASIEATYGRKRAVLKLSHDFFSYPLDDMVHFLTHEICHLLSEPINDVIDNGPETLMGKPAFTMFNESYLLAMEHMTDHIARFVVWTLSDGARRGKVVAALDRVRVSE